MIVIGKARRSLRREWSTRAATMSSPSPAAATRVSDGATSVASGTITLIAPAISTTPSVLNSHVGMCRAYVVMGGRVAA